MHSGRMYMIYKTTIWKHYWIRISLLQDRGIEAEHCLISLISLFMINFNIVVCGLVACTKDYLSLTYLNLSNWLIETGPGSLSNELWVIVSLSNHGNPHNSNPGTVFSPLWDRSILSNTPAYLGARSHAWSNTWRLFLVHLAVSVLMHNKGNKKLWSFNIITQSLWGYKTKYDPI